MDNDGLNRYKIENGSTVIEVAVKNSRQLFNERDPAPFRERDLDQQFVNYLVSSVEEVPMKQKIKIRIVTSDEVDLTTENSQIIIEAIKTYFEYEAKMSRLQLKNLQRNSRVFSLIGFITLCLCLTLSELVGGKKSASTAATILGQGLVIVGWIAMWRPIESLLYDWWPVREQRKRLEKIATNEIEIVGGNPG